MQITKGSLRGHSSSWKESLRT